MRSIIGMAAALAVCAGPATAAELVCESSAKGKAGEAQARLVVRDGAIVSGTLSWLPTPDRSSTPGAMLVLSRDYADPLTGAAGPVRMIISGNAARAAELKHERAVVAVSSNIVPPIGKEWQIFRNAAAEAKAGRGPSSPDAILFGTVPFDRSDPGAIPLLESLDQARTVITSVISADSTAVISRGLFWVNGRMAADALAKQAHAKALQAAQGDQAGCRAEAAGS
jgi:hypothetical protein